MLFPPSRLDIEACYATKVIFPQECFCLQNQGLFLFYIPLQKGQSRWKTWHIAEWSISMSHVISTCISTQYINASVRSIKVKAVIQWAMRENIQQLSGKKRMGEKQERENKFLFEVFLQPYRRNQTHILYVHMHLLYISKHCCGLAHRTCMSFSWRTHPKHTEEKWNPFWLKLKFIVNQSSAVSEMQVHACLQIQLPHTHMHISPKHTSVFVLSCSL